MTRLLLLSALLVVGCAPRHVPRSPPEVDPTRRVDVLVALTRNAATHDVERRVDGVLVADRASLEKRLAEVAAPGGKVLRSDVVVTIDAPSEVPWSDVVGAVNACKKAGLEHVEFALGADAKSKK